MWEVTPNMIKAGQAAFYGHFDNKGAATDCFDHQVTAIYRAMCDKRQEDALKMLQERR